MLARTKELADIVGISKKSLLQRAQKEGWPAIKKQEGFLFSVESLPLSIRQRVYNSGFESGTKEPEGFVETSDAQREKAVWKARLIFEAELFSEKKIMNLHEFVEQYNTGLILPEVLCKLGCVSARTLYRWIKDYRTKGVDALVRNTGKVTGAGVSLSVIERYYLEHFYLDTSLPTMKYAHRMMQANLPDSACTYSTARRYLQSLPQVVVDYKRLGITKFETLHQPAVSQDVTRYASLEKVVSDHHCLDFVIMYRGKLIRPWITAFQDFRSGKILGWCPSVAPSSFSILAAYYMMVMQYGIPHVCLFDNGKDYRSKLINGYNEEMTVYLPSGLTEEQTVYIQGVLPMIGSKVQFTEVYHGQSKGRLERTFGIFADYLSKPSGTYIGRDTTTRPEEVQTYYRAINKKAQREAFPDWQWLIKAMGAIVNYINEALPSDGKGMQGKTRSQVFNENLPANIRKADKDVLILALTRGEKRRVSKSSVKMNGTVYFAEELFIHNGEDVIVRQKLYTGDTVTVCDARGSLICDAVADYLAEGKDLNETIKRVKGIRKRNLKQLAEMGTRENLPAPEYENMIEVARNMYSQNQFEDFEDPSVLIEDKTEPMEKAVGAEHQNLSDKKNKYISPLDADAEQWARRL